MNSRWREYILCLGVAYILIFLMRCQRQLSSPVQQFTTGIRNSCMKGWNIYTYETNCKYSLNIIAWRIVFFISRAIYSLINQFIQLSRYNFFFKNKKKCKKINIKNLLLNHRQFISPIIFLSISTKISKNINIIRFTTYTIFYQIFMFFFFLKLRKYFERRDIQIWLLKKKI